MKTIRLTTCKDLFEAQLLRGKLENASILVVLNNEIMNSYPPMSGVDIFVSESDYDNALAIIKEQ